MFGPTVTVLLLLWGAIGLICVFIAYDGQGHPADEPWLILLYAEMALIGPAIILFVIFRDLARLIGGRR